MKDSIAVVSVSSPIPNVKKFNADLSALKKDGFSIIVGKYVLQRMRGTGGTTEQRLGDIRDVLLRNNAIKLILCAYGGAYTIQLVEKFPYDLFKKTPCVVSGFSDNTSLLVAITQQTAIPTLYGPTAWYWQYIQKKTKQRFLVLLRGQESVPLVSDKSQWKVLKHGAASGKLIGGNLSALQMLLGTPFEPNWQDALLYWEDWNMSPVILNETLNHFRLAGVFHKISGMIIGSCPNCEEKVGRFPVPSLEETIFEQTNGSRFLIVKTNTFGHDIQDFFTMPNGVLATLDTKKHIFETLEPVGLDNFTNFSLPTDV